MTICLRNNRKLLINKIKINHELFFESGNDDEEEDELRQMTRDDFDFVLGRIDRMELSVANVISKVGLFFMLNKKFQN